MRNAITCSILCGLCFLVSACYSFDNMPPNGTRDCASDRNCPDGYVCAYDGKCYVAGSQPIPDLSAPIIIDLASPIVADLSRPPDLIPFCATCQAPTPVCDAMNSRCVVCLPGNDVCPPGNYCAVKGSSYECVPGCKLDPECAMPVPDGGAPVQAACCDHRCTDLLGDLANCGKCGSACAQTCCGGICADTSKDPKNCGGCGRPCGGEAHAMATCSQSLCKVTSCAAGYADCNMDPSDGCEAFLKTDVSNCGACGNFCSVPNGMGACNGTCSLKGCFKGFFDCDGKYANGCEVAISGDPKNCGVCGKVCPAPANATPGCIGGLCDIGVCLPGFGDCDNNPATGCETNLNTSANNCSGCGDICKVANGTASCVNAQCAVGACNSPFKDCNGNPVDGCETDVATDLANCGRCGNACTAVNGNAACNNGICIVGSCAMGYGDCNKIYSDGCEANLQTDKNNCGACGNACANGLLCAGGACVNCGNDCWGPSGCLTAGGHCIQFTCRAGDAGGSFCNQCRGWKEISIDQWLNGGYCADVSAMYHQVAGNATQCGKVPTCCVGSNACAGGDIAWHFFDGVNTRYVGPPLNDRNNMNCGQWNMVEPSAYTRLTACERP